MAHALRLLLAAGALAASVAGRPDSALLLGAAAGAATLSGVAGARPGADLAFVGSLAVYVSAVAAGLLEVLPHADVLAHLVLPALTVELLHAAVAGRPPPRVSVVPAAVAAFCLAIAWEGAEAAADGIAGTNFFLGVGDAAGDLLAGAAGITFAAAVLRRRGAKAST